MYHSGVKNTSTVSKKPSVQFRSIFLFCIYNSLIEEGSLKGSFQDSFDNESIFFNRKRCFMKEHNNLYDFHSVYLKKQMRDSENWERIEGVFDAQARMSQPPVKVVSLRSIKNKMIGGVSKSTNGIPSTMRKIVRFFNHQK